MALGTRAVTPMTNGGAVLQQALVDSTHPG
jgi:hypothetical protein